MGVVGVAVVSLPAGVLLGLAGTAMLARKDFPPLEATCRAGLPADDEIDIEGLFALIETLLEPKR